MAEERPTTKHYKSWTALECVDWIISINSIKFEKYRNDLTITLIENNFNGSSMKELDSVDLKDYGIINADDRKQIFNAINILMANQKKRDSQIKMEMDPEALLSLSDEEEDEDGANYKTLLSDKQFLKLTESGFCRMDNDETDNLLLVNLITGYIRTNHMGQGMIAEIINAIVYFHGAKFNSDEYVQLESGGQKPMYYLTKKENIKLSGLLISLPCSHTLECRQVPGITLGHVLTYLGYHKGIEPEPLPCPIRSIHMKDVCADQWDADYIDAFDKKTIFEIILAANYLDIKPLLHLGAAKIASLIKQLDQTEINRIIEEEENYRREQAEKEREKQEATESVFGLSENENAQTDGNDGNDDDKENDIKGLDEDEKK